MTESELKLFATINLAPWLSVYSGTFKMCYIKKIIDFWRKPAPPELTPAQVLPENIAL